MKHLSLTAVPPLTYSCEEEMNALCTNLSFFGSDKKCIMVTSCQASEGKSLMTMNMLRTFSKLGKCVVFVDADLRRSVIDARYGIRYQEPSAYGLTHYLAGHCEMEDVIYRTNITGGLMVPVGREVANSLTLLASPRFPYLMDYLSEIADFVLIDAPPVGIIIDAAEIAKSCDGAILAVHYNRISRRELMDAKQQIERTGCPVLGAVLNNVTLDSFASRKYYNKSYYSQYNNEYMSTDKRKSPRKAGKTKAVVKNNAK